MYIRSLEDCRVLQLLIKILLLPFSLLYYIGVSLRNIAFNLGILTSKTYHFPIICIGNLSVGGTGKTPHTEYLIRLLQNEMKIATLSRGYGRKSKGFKVAKESDDAKTIGDEPYQIFKKFKKVIVAVDEQRRRGIEKLMQLKSSPDVIILDDAFQHRKVKAGLNVLLTDYSKLFLNDLVLPAGRLREPIRAARRADLIVVTKSPNVLSPLEIRRIEGMIKPTAYQKVFFSYIEYDQLNPLNASAESLDIEFQDVNKYGVLLVTAIANPKPLMLHLKRYAKEVECFNFKDHHYFSENDYSSIGKKSESLLSSKKLIVITEKDATKFDQEKLSHIPIFSIPMKVNFHEQQGKSFENEVRNYVRSYTKSS